jgi:hypothetical protein
MLAGCFDSATQQSATKDLVVKLSKGEEQLLDAMAFLFSGMEDNIKDGKFMPWRREVEGRTIEFSARSRSR